MNLKNLNDSQYGGSTIVAIICRGTGTDVYEEGGGSSFILLYKRFIYQVREYVLRPLLKLDRCQKVWSRHLAMSYHRRYPATIPQLRRLSTSDELSMNIPHHVVA